QDMREMGGLARHLPVTTMTFTVGALALGGVFPLAGFFSKDEIITLLLEEGHYLAFATVVVASGLTAFYVTRLWFRVFSGPEQTEGLREGHRTMLAPMVLLALITSVLGFASPMFASFMGGEGHWPELRVALIGTAVAATGISVGWWFYGRRSVVVNTRVWKQRMGWLYSALVQKLYFDRTYDAVFVRGYFMLADGAAWFDQRVVDGVVNGAAIVWRTASDLVFRFDQTVVDGAVNGLAALARLVGGGLRRLQTGRLQTYQRLVVGGAVVLMLILVVTRGA
ncbi:MAG: hypothetical protein FDZ75_07685, partial [Actinobacteria bacterium]